MLTGSPPVSGQALAPRRVPFDASAVGVLAWDAATRSVFSWALKLAGIAEVAMKTLAFSV